MKNIKIWIAAAVVLIAVVVIGALAFSGGGGADRFQEQLELGQRYLEEMDYEQAVVAFTAAIEIDPRNADAYLGLADAYAGMGDLDAAIAALEEGYELTGDERLRDYIDALQGGAAPSGPQAVMQTGPITLPFTAEDFTLAGYSIVEENFEAMADAIGVRIYHSGTEETETLDEFWLDTDYGRVTATDFTAEEDSSSDYLLRIDDLSGSNGYIACLSGGPEGHEQRSLSCSMSGAPDILQSPIAVGDSLESVRELLKLDKLTSEPAAEGSGIKESYVDALGGAYSVSVSEYEDTEHGLCDSYVLWNYGVDGNTPYVLWIHISQAAGTVAEWQLQVDIS